ncbi:EF-hand domain-containing protein [Phthorimaea operculella]|nr:EF-hand domain-containing protein [Phthorimaea operculella]
MESGVSESVPVAVDQEDEKKKGKKQSSPVDDRPVVPSPSEAMLNNLRTAFGLLDRDADGHVTPAELQFMLRNLGIQVSDDLIADLIKDASRTGQYTEISSSSAHIHPLQGIVTPAELQFMLRNLGIQVSDDLIADLIKDASRTGQYTEISSSSAHIHPLQGIVTPAELQFMLRNLGIQVSDDLIADLIKDASRTGNGLIDENEFMQWVTKIQAIQGMDVSNNLDSEEEITRDLLAAFKVFDRDDNGYITRDELREALEMIGEPVTDAQLNQVLALGDIDHDGRIDYEEFVKMLL